MTNYERVRDGDIDPKKFCAVALDEASVLRSFGSKTYQTFLQKFRGVKYKLVCTATPLSPNRYKELIHYAAFLEVMDSVRRSRAFSRGTARGKSSDAISTQGAGVLVVGGELGTADFKAERFGI
ncbi:MAG: hypothetical protein ACLS7Z_00200 [Christensenellales bacterium]